MKPKVKVVYRHKDRNRRMVNKFDVMQRKEGEDQICLVERFDDIESARKLKRQLSV